MSPEFSPVFLTRSQGSRTLCLEVRASMDKHVTDAMKRLKRIRDLMSKQRSPYEGMTKDQAIDAMRKVREQLWEEKLAHHP